LSGWRPPKQSRSVIGIWPRAGSRPEAIPTGESLSDILQGLERDILRILTRTLITEPIAAGIRGGIKGDETSAGGLEGLLNKAFGTGGLIFGEDQAEEPTITRVDSEIADQATTSLLALGDAGDTTGALLTGSLSEGAAKAGIETLTQASTSAVATTQLGELAIAAGAAAAALQALLATAGTGGAGGGGGGPLGLLSNIPGVGQFLTPVLGNSVTGGFGTSNPLAAGFSGNPHFAAGGPVSGPGGSTGDRIPAFLSDGEFVVSARAARRHRRLLALINAGITPPAFATGGQVPPFQRFANADMTPSSARPAAGPQAAPDAFMRPIVVNINNPTSVPEIQRGIAQIRGSLREMLDRAQRRDS
jgi:hypothetical protein